jgi:hypothetical protein
MHNAIFDGRPPVVEAGMDWTLRTVKLFHKRREATLSDTGIGKIDSLMLPEVLYNTSVRPARVSQDGPVVVICSGA